jgi:prepilin-type N-terminal cleavage/methylation domain-containing protein
MVNMMENKGFTLIELIVTITILVIVGLVISSNITGLFSEQEDKEYEEFKDKITSAACMYVETAWDSTTRSECKRNNNCTVHINELIARGYIDEDLKDPSTDEFVSANASNYDVEVTWSDNVKTCKLNI